MASLIKNQILKHLSKFAKNLSPDKLQLSTLKGHCELHNLELDEIMLTDLLELPTWLKLSQAVCNHVTLKIHWTKLKSVPIYLSLDEVMVNMETCEELRPPSPSTGHSSYSTGGKYGFSDRVIDGMTVVANSVVINFRSPAFQASFQLSRVVLESYSPDWKKKDMRLSRIKDAERGEILLFKRLEWQVLRIEATAKQNSVKGVHLDVPLTPLRLITNQACCKITFKKRLIDSTLIGSRLILILDDLLWVLTDAQLVAALHFLQSLSGLIQSATQVTQKAKAKHKLEQNPEKLQHSSLHSKSNSRFSSLFTHHDVVETSQHLLCSRIDLHLCDDLDPKDGRSQHPNLRGGGALQVSLHKLVVDYYPYHHAFNSREHWLRYTEPSSGRNTWVQQLLTLFYEYFPTKSMQIDVLDSDQTSGKVENAKHLFAHRSSSISSPTRKSTINCRPEEKQSSFGKSGSFQSSDLASDEKKSTNVDQNKKSSMQWNLRFLMSNCIVLRLEEFTVYKVSTSTASKKHSLEKFMASNRSVHLPPDMKTIHMELTTYYLPGDLSLPVPSPNMFLHFGSVQMIFDPPTILWLNAFQLNLQKCLVIKSQPVQSSSTVNIRVESLMPQITFPTDKNAPTEPERPKSLNLRASRIIVTNCRIGDHASKAHLNHCLKVVSNSSLFSETSKYPWSTDDMKPMAGRFLEQLIEQVSFYQKIEQKNSTDSVPNSPVVQPILPKNLDCDIWSVHLDPCWADFAICESGRTRLHAFIDPLPLTLWFYIQKDSSVVCTNNSEKNDVTQSPTKSEACNIFSESHSKNHRLSGVLQDALPLGNSALNSQNAKTEANMYILVHVHSLLNVQMNHYHYLFLLRLLDSITELSTQISYDTSVIIKGKPTLTSCITALWPQIEVSVILRSLNQMSATSDSVDLASLQEDCSSPSEIAHASKRSFQASQSSFSVMECEMQSKQTHSNKKCVGALDDSCIENGLPKSCSDSLLNCHSPPASHSTTPPPPIDASNSPEKTSDTLHKGIQSGTSAVKRGFCSLVASIDSAFTKNESNNSGDGENTSFPDEDTLSLRSDFSSDLDHFVIFGQESVAVDDDFAHYHVNEEIDVEMATEMKEDTISNYTLNSEKKREMISVTTFKLTGLECVQQLAENKSNLLLMCNHVEITEHAAISWENFQNSFSSRSRGWQADKEKYSSTECRLRFSSDNNSSKETKTNKNTGYLSLLASNLHLCLLMSSVSGLVDFFEDEVITLPFPARIILNNFKVQLQGDQCPTTSNSMPIHINLPGCFLERTHDGIVNILPLPTDYIKNEINPSSILNPTSFEDSPSENVISNTTDNTMLLTSLLQTDLSTSIKNSSVVDAEDTALHNKGHFNTYVCNIHLDNSKENKASHLGNIVAENEEQKTKLTSLHMLQMENERLKKELHLLKNVKDTNELTEQLLEARREIRRIEDEKKILHEKLKSAQNELSRLLDEKNLSGVK